MKYPSISFFKKMNFSRIPSRDLPLYAYALTSCLQPASVVGNKWFRAVAESCKEKVRELREQIALRLKNNDSSEHLMHALAILDGTSNLVNDAEAASIFEENQNMESLTVSDLIGLHSLSRSNYNALCISEMEPFTRAFQWRIVDELDRHKGCKSLSAILRLIEYIEADGYAFSLSLPYRVGDKPSAFNPMLYSSDEALACHIRDLSEKKDYIAREELIMIAEHIQADFVERDMIADRIASARAILCTGMPSFRYPKIAKALEGLTPLTA